MTHQAKKLDGPCGRRYETLAKAWLFIYSLLYFSAAIQGMRSGLFTPIVSLIFLILMGVMSLLAVYVEKRVLRLILSAIWAYATIANWMKTVHWIPPYSDLQYTVMALMNMVQAICLAYLGEVWRLE